jgi:hypothetical protein
MNSKKKTITTKCGTPRRILITLFAALFVMSLPGTSGAQTLSLTGKVAGIDKHKQILTVDGSHFYAPNRGSDYGGAAGISTFALDKRAYVMKGSQKMGFDDIPGQLKTATPTIAAFTPVPCSPGVDLEQHHWLWVKSCPCFRCHS